MLAIIYTFKVKHKGNCRLSHSKPNCVLLITMFLKKALFVFMKVK